MYKIISLMALAFFIFILWIIYLANTDASSIFFDFIDSIPYGDKLGHIGLFGMLTFITTIGLRFRSVNLGSAKLYIGVMLVALFALTEEISQAFIPSRTFDLIDLTADTLGISMAAILAFLLHRLLIKQGNSRPSS